MFNLNAKQQSKCFSGPKNSFFPVTYEVYFDGIIFKSIVLVVFNYYFAKTAHKENIQRALFKACV